MWITTDLPGQFDPVRCEPRGLFAKFNARIRGDAFWQARLLYLRAERDRLATSLNRPRNKTAAPIDPAVEKAQQLMRSIGERYPELAPRPAADTAAQLRKLANEIERQDFEEQLLEHFQRELTAVDRCIKAIQAPVGG